MTWTVLEQCVIPHNAEQGPEDGLLIMPEKGLYVVADSHSSHVKKLIQGLTPGQFVLSVFLDTCSQIAVPGSREDVPLWIERLNTAVRNGLECQDRFEEVFNSAEQTFIRRPGLVFVAFVSHLSLIVRVGDCQYFLDGDGHNPGLEVDRIKAQIRKHEMLRHLGTTSPFLPSDHRDSFVRKDPTGSLMRSFNTDWQQRFRNDAGSACGYGVINGTNTPDVFIEMIEVPEYVQRVTLTSDGMPPICVCSTLEETMKSFNHALARDPLCIGSVLVGVRGGKVGDDGKSLRPYDDFTGIWTRRNDVC